MARICVDSTFIQARIGGTSSKWCHLFTDEPENPEALEALHVFAERIGLKRSWFQAHHFLPHYDVSIGMRIKALRAGAAEATREDILRVYDKVYGENARFLPDPKGKTNL